MSIQSLDILLEEAVVLVQAGTEYQKALELCATIIQAEQIDNMPETHCKVLLLQWQIYWQMNQLELARNSAARALEKAIHCALPLYQIKALNNLGIMHRSQAEYIKALEFFSQAQEISVSGYISELAPILANIGNTYENLGVYDKALEYSYQSLALLKENNQGSDSARLLGNMGIIHASLGDLQKAQECFDESLQILKELGMIVAMARIYGNTGIIYARNKQFMLALEYYHKALNLYQQQNMQIDIARIYGNMGNLYALSENIQKAIQHMEMALEIYESLQHKSGIAHIKGNLGCIYTEHLFQPEKAEQLLADAAAINLESGAESALAENYRDLSVYFEKKQKWQESYEYFRKFYELEQKIDIQKARHTSILLENERKAAEYEKKIAVQRAQEAARIEEQQKLIYNMLPESIATQLLSGKEFIARHQNNVSVLFADIVNFTGLTESISPDILVRGLDELFTLFDEYTVRAGAEKIKTIGDSYMVAAGVPKPCADHADRLAYLSIELLHIASTFRFEGAHHPINLRIGIHSGNVIAGIIGKKKIAYDLWGDTVNIAARMESHGLPGKIHITEDFRQHIISLPEFNCTARGAVEIKGKGMMNTYFMEKV